MTLKFDSASYVCLADMLVSLCTPLPFMVFVYQYSLVRCTVVTCRKVQQIAEPLKCVGPVVGIGRTKYVHRTLDFGSNSCYCLLACDAVSSGIYDMIYLTAIGLTPGGSGTVHIYTQYTEYRAGIHITLKN
jgi:hypothetical protein